MKANQRADADASGERGCFLWGDMGTYYAVLRTLAFDTGINANDGITSNGLVNVVLDPEALSWRYSTDGGISWSVDQDFNITSFTLAPGVYAAGAVQVEE